MNDNSTFWTTDDMGMGGIEDGASSPPVGGGGLLVTIDHVLESIPAILDTWRRPVTVQRTGSTTTITPTSQTMTQQSTLLLVAVIAGLVWAVS